MNIVNILLSSMNKTTVYRQRQNVNVNDANPDSSSPSPSPSPSPRLASRSPISRTPSPPPPSPPLSLLPPSPPPTPPPPLQMPPGGRPYIEPIELHSLGPMNIQCSKCHAFHFLSEKLSNSSASNPHFGPCCLQGQVVLPPIQQWPTSIQALLDDPQDNREFRKNIRQYNNALALTSVGVEVDRQTVQGAGPASFHIHGTLHHLMGTLIPLDNHQPSYAQLYIMIHKRLQIHVFKEIQTFKEISCWTCTNYSQDTISMLHYTSRPMRS